MRESVIETHLVKRVKELGGEIRKVRFLDRRGAPDRFVILPTQMAVWVELKAPGQKAKPNQLREHQRLRAMGQSVVVIDSIEGVEALLQ